MVGVISRHDLGVRVVAGERGAENHAGVVAQGVGQAPAVRQLRSFGGGLVTHDQRNAGIAHGVDSHGDRQPRDPVEGSEMLGRNAELLFQIEGAAPARQLDHIGDIGDGLKRRLSVVALHQPP